MKKLLLLQEERERLRGLPHVIWCMYVVCLRERMHPLTRMVGAEQPFLSWQAVREDLYVEPLRGTLTLDYSRFALLRMAKHLEARGLVKNWSDAAERRLIFELLHAPVDSYVQKEPAPLPARSVHRGNPLLPAPLPAQHLNTVSLSIGKLNGTPARDPRAVDNSEPLIFPSGLNTLENRELRSLLSNSKLNGSRQLYLDELQGAFDGKTVFRKGPAAYVQALINADRRGTFKPTIRGMNVEQRRAKSGAALTVQRNNAAQQHAPKAEPRAPRSGAGGGTDALAILKRGRRR